MYEILVTTRGILFRRPDTNEAVRTPRRMYVKDEDVSMFRNQFRMLSLDEEDDFIITKLSEEQEKQITDEKFKNVTGKTNRLSGTGNISLSNRMGNRTGF